MTTTQQSGLLKSGKKTRHHAAFSRGGSCHVDVTTQQASPCEGDVKGQAAQQPPPHDGKGKRGQQQQQRNDARAGAWANALKYGKQVRLSAKMELLIGTAMTQMLAKNNEPITSKVNQAVAAQLRTLRKAGPLGTCPAAPPNFRVALWTLTMTKMAGLEVKLWSCLLALGQLHSLLTPNLTMAGTPKVRHSPPSKSASPIIITQWNCQGLRSRTKTADLRLFLSSFEQICPWWLPSKSQGRALPLRTIRLSNRTPRLCVHRDYTANKVDLDLQTNYFYVMVTLLPLRKQDSSFHILNVYCSPKLQNASFADLFSCALRVAGLDPLLIVGDFNAPSRVWGYGREEKRGRKLAELTPRLGLALHTDHVHPTRIGNSVTRDTCPDLTFTRNIQFADWANTEETLGSDHCLINTTIRTAPWHDPTNKPTSHIGRNSDKLGRTLFPYARTATKPGPSNWFLAWVLRKHTSNSQRRSRMWITSSSTFGKSGTASSVDGAI
ncbi:hypothetical protein HPB49_019035 [Dermacentor silvarum]|uniref:Uncharacterized protein n=1 Tax=Dermacentor silvarum TaxID=543639 RepID=A0ACB8DQW2_DERSI|nr:hypothetical protein HPB49_019035 [Dermacentor silvarum]